MSSLRGALVNVEYSDTALTAPEYIGDVTGKDFNSGNPYQVWLSTGAHNPHIITDAGSGYKLAASDDRTTVITREAQQEWNVIGNSPNPVALQLPGEVSGSYYTATLTEARKVTQAINYGTTLFLTLIATSRSSSSSFGRVTLSTMRSCGTSGPTFEGFG
ncbi:hypothetical protein BDR07DRAFT_913641 [Suillus spraguei]|nr:hypothetical protein BDR07DRAFT_913641 [Suillus spraguei]